MIPIAPRHDPLWPVSVQSTARDPGIGCGSMNDAGSNTRLPKKPCSMLPSAWIVQRLWIGMAGRSTYSQRP